MEAYNFKDHYKPVEISKKLANAQYRKEHFQPITHPDTTTLQNILRAIDTINYSIKLPTCMIRKYPFYKLKHEFIEWCVMMDRFGLDDNIKVKVNGVEPAPGTSGHLLAVEINIGGVSKTFHMPMKECVSKWILFDEINDRPINDYYHDEGDPEKNMRTVNCIWEELLRTMEANNWFIYDDMLAGDWFDTIKKKYKHAKLTIPIRSFKLDIMVNGGPMVYSRGHEVGRLIEFRRNFAKIIAGLGKNLMEKSYKS